MKTKNSKVYEVIFNALDEILLNELPDDIDTLSTHSRFEEIKELDFIEKSENDEGVLIEGKAVVSYNLQFGSDSDVNRGDGSVEIREFPMTFKGILKKEEEKYKFDNIEYNIDTSSYFK